MVLLIEIISTYFQTVRSFFKMIWFSPNGSTTVNVFVVKSII